MMEPSAYFAAILSEATALIPTSYGRAPAYFVTAFVRKEND